MAQYDAFISYNSREANQVQHIAEWLKAEGIQVFLDKWELRPGDKLVRALGDALSESECCLVIIGENGISPWHENEIYSVLDATIDGTMKRVIPVFLPGTNPPKKRTELPWFLRGILYITFEKSVNEIERLQEIKFGITGNRDNNIIEFLECPFRGLEVFREKDCKFFFGREALIQQLHSEFERLDNNRLLAVLGPSGSGKSSAVQAGLIPRLRIQNALIKVLTPGNNPVENLAFALRDLFDPRPNVEALKKRLDTNREALHLISGELKRDLNKNKVVLIIDQFEELFTLCAKEIWVKDFIDLLIYAVEVAGGSTYVILTMRSDFMGHCSMLPRLNDYISHNIEQVGLMNVQELRDAIQQPAWKTGLSFEAGLVDVLLNDVRNSSAKLPLLQFALKELYNQRNGKKLTHKAYRGMGGIEKALAQRADTEYQQLSTEEQNLLQKIFLSSLIQIGEGTESTRRRASKKELYGSGQNDKVEKLIQQWSGAELRLLTVSVDPQQGDVVEIAHEALIHQWTRLSIWINDNREQVLLRNALRREALEWQAQLNDDSYLPQGSKLLRYEDQYMKEHKSFTNLEKDFIEEAINKRNAATKRIHEKYWQRAVFEREKGKMNEFIAFAAEALLLQRNSNSHKEFQIKSCIQRELENLPISINHNGLYGAKFCHSEERVLSWSSDGSIQLFSVSDGTILQKFEHDQRVNGAAFDKSEERVLSWSMDGSIRIWSVTEGSILQKFEHDEWVFGAAFDKSEERVLSWSADGSVRLWSLADGTMLQKFDHKLLVRGAMFNKLEKLVLSWSTDGSVRLWSVSDGTTLQKFEHDRAVFGATFDKSEERVLSWSMDGSIRLWSLDDGTMLQQFEHDDYGYGAMFNKSEECVLSWSDDGSVRLWSVSDGAILQKFEHDQSVNGAVFDESEERVLSWSDDGSVRVWSVTDGTILQKFEHDEGVYGAEFDKSEERVLSWSDDGSIRLWWVMDGTMLRKFDHKGIYKVIFDRSDERIISFSAGGLRIWLLSNDTVPQMFEYGHGRKLLGGAIFNRSEECILIWSSDLWLWSLSDGTMLQKFESNEFVRGAIFNRCEEHLLSWSMNGSMRLWSVTDGTILQKFEHDKQVFGAAFDKSDDRVLSWSDDGSVRVWSVTDGTILQKFEHNEGVYGAVFDKSEERVLSWSTDGSVRLWSVTEGTMLQKFEHDQRVNGAVFDESEERVLSWSDDGSVRLWLVAGGKILQKFKHNGKVNGAILIRSGEHILSWSTDGYIRLWSPSNGTMLQKFGGFDVNEVAEVLFDQSEERMLSWNDNNGTISLWSIDDGTMLQNFEHDKRVIGVVFDKSEERILSWSIDGSVRIWSLSDGVMLQKFEVKGVKEVKFDQSEERLFICGKFKLQIEDIKYDRCVDPRLISSHFTVSTRMRLNPITGILEEVSINEWAKINKKYQKKARKHFMVCKYPLKNIWALHHPYEARKIRPDVIW